MCSTEILLNTDTIRDVKRLQLTHFLLKIVRREKHRITRHFNAELQTSKQTLTTSKHSTEFIYSDFPCHLKVNRDKLALINRQWKREKGKRSTITVNRPFAAGVT